MDTVQPSGPRERLAQSLLSRRRFLRQAAVAGVGVPVASALLAACGGSSKKTPTSASSASTTSSGGSTTPTSAAVTINQNASPSAASASPTAAAEGKAGGSVTFLRSVDSLSADPVLWHNPDIWPFLSVYEQLVKVGDDGVSLAPGLAEKWDTSTDGLTYTFHIRQGVKFSDGTDLSTDDIIWSLQRAKADQKGGWNFSLMQVKDITAPDANTIVITVTGIWAPFLSDVSLFNGSIISKAFATKVGEANLTSQAMGTGPFSLKEWKRSDHVTLAKNTHYWVANRPYLDEIVLKQVPNTNSQILQVKGGQADGIIGQGDVALNQVPDLKKDSNLQVLSFLSTYNNFVILNTKNAPLNDVKLRQALNFATDKQSIITTILFGNADISNSFMPNGMLYWNKDQPAYPFDVDQANQLMAQSQSPNGVTISFQIPSGNQLQVQIATALKAMWAKIKVNLDIQQLDAAVVRQNNLDEKYEAMLSGWTNDIIDPDELVSYAILPESNDDYHTGWQDPQAISLAHQAQTTLDPAKRQQLYYQIQQIHKDAAPFVYLFVLPYIDVLSAKVKGFFHHPMGQYVFTNTYLES
ncbi:MAG TPA: ABC transporter substrate-binding protein [Nitrolancea sp.]